MAKKTGLTEAILQEQAQPLLQKLRDNQSQLPSVVQSVIDLAQRQRDFLVEIAGDEEAEDFVAASFAKGVAEAKASLDGVDPTVKAVVDEFMSALGYKA